MNKLLRVESVQRIFNAPLEQELLKSAYSHYSDLNDPFRCNVFSLLLRETVRIALGRIAPDAAILSTSWYKTTDPSKGPNRADRLRYALLWKVPDNIIDQYAQLTFKPEIENLKKILASLSKYAHISPGTIKLTQEDADCFLEKAETCLIDFCDKYHSVKSFLSEKILEITQEAIIENMWNELPSELDALSTHTRFENAEISSGEMLYEDKFVFNGKGYLEFNLTYGSEREGVSCDGSCPFTFEAFLNSDLSVDSISFDIDTSPFYDSEFLNVPLNDADSNPVDNPTQNL